METTFKQIMEKGRILIVDDDKAFLMLVSHILRKSDYEVETVSESDKAYETIVTFAPDLIILDVEMPNLDGEALLRIIKGSKLTGHIPVMFLSAVSAAERIKRDLHDGAEDFLSKPINPEVFKVRIQMAMQRIKHSSMVRNIVSRYLGPDVAEMILMEPETLKVYGLRRKIASLFADIRNFSRLVESMEPEDVVMLLNRVLSDFADSIFSIGGTIDKFIGDGVMAFWGAPLEREDMEVMAVEAALLMMDKNRAFNASKRYPAGMEIQIGIGISVGNAVVGNIGYEKRSDYTVIGESVNIASRLENMAKPGQILVTKEIHEKVKDNYLCEEVGKLPIKGKTLPIRIYEITGRA